MPVQILKEFQRHKVLTASRLAKKLKVTPQAVHRHLKKLLREGRILKQGTSRKTTYYALNQPSVLRRLQKSQRVFKKRYENAGLREDEVFIEIDRQSQVFGSLSANAKSLFHYAFTEMMNNAIDHSQSRFIDVLVESNSQSASFSIADHGIGIFKNIMTKKNLGNEMEALQDLLKGKQTTLPTHHSGEGIFFTSKIADRFVIESHKKKLTIDNQLNDIFVSDIRLRPGTKVSFELQNRSTKKLDEVFRRYTSEEFQFQKSQVTVKLFKTGEEYVSRSQAKRLLHALDSFKEIILDFREVDTIGQGFADEVFRVFASQHPDIKIVPIHCHENVQFMINRAKTAGF